MSRTKVKVKSMGNHYTQGMTKKEVIDDIPNAQYLGKDEEYLYFSIFERDLWLLDQMDSVRTHHVCTTIPPHIERDD